MRLLSLFVQWPFRCRQSTWSFFLIVFIPHGETVFIQNVILPYRFHSLWGERSSYKMSFFLIVFFLNAVEVEVNGFDVRAFQKVYTV